MKTLWIGCSHSSGIFDSNDKRQYLPAPKNNIPLPGLPSEISYEYNNWNNWKIISAPGQGIIEFSSIMTYLHYSDLLDFDNVIIQNTNEPRIVSFDYKSENQKFKYLKEYIEQDNNERLWPYYRYDSDYTHQEDFKMTFNMHPVSLFSRYQNYFKDINTKTTFLEIAEEISSSVKHSTFGYLQMAYDNILEITRKRNINFYTFCWENIQSSYGNYYSEDYKQYDIFNGHGLCEIISNFRENCHIESRHPNKKAIELAVPAIIDALKQKGFEG